MLVDTFEVFNKDFILDVIAEANKRSSAPKQLAKGVYEIDHFGGTSFLSGFEHYPEFKDNPNFDCYGVCDNYQQIFEVCPEILESDRKFVVTVHHLTKKDQSPEGGWRWHKWGPYIGKQTPTTEYLYDEPVIEEVYVSYLREGLTMIEEVLEDKQEIITNRRWWESFGKWFGWRLYGFTCRQWATFVTSEQPFQSLRLTAEQRNQIEAKLKGSKNGRNKPS